MKEKIRNFTSAAAAVLATGLAPAAHAADAPAKRSAHATQAPVVMRLSKDEFRIAFGVGVRGCEARGCSGVIRYTVAWKTEDGALVSESKRVHYSVPPHYGRAMTVDRQYFDTAEGAHTTELVRVTVASISCADGVGGAALQGARTVAEL